MRTLTILVFLTILTSPFQRTYSARTVSLDDLVGLYKPSGDATAPWVQIEKTLDGKNADIFLLSSDFKTKTKLLTSEAGHFKTTTGEVSTQAVPSPVGFIVVQSQIHKGDTSFISSDFVNVAQFDRALESVLKIQWLSHRFTKESLSQGTHLETREIFTYQKQTQI